ncbi:LysM peptidoglycan-binding domain-containing protein [Aeromicrobium sp. S22]|uniref:LysM peptidoglycan-binding domain-containing protein n=1 Tax=Aeromicrobium sp. S22 TaxID=2662029 RepID=UPI00129D7037|nr:LysM peptidoglycan-binding domain-containing protein [Aeromicrobium sp. S22]MRK01019.1 LysM peptidoglycan-binding domain-containing protein [Aeromicrobium sp. S22]
MRLSGWGWAMTALAAGSVYVLAPEAASSADALAGPSFAAALLALGSLVQLALSGWVLGAVLLTLAARSSRLACAVMPAAMRRALFVGAVGAMTLAPAHAEEIAAPGSRAPHSVNGLRLPDRPTAAAPSDVTSRARATPRPVIVRPGDTLWAIASRSLPPDASPAVVAHAVERWHAANRTAIGSDPDLIFPGQHLTPPTGKDHP